MAQAAAGSLLGVRSLKIDVVQSPSETDRVLTFRSLGVEPRLVVTLANQSRLSALGWGLALAVGLVGVAMTRRPARKKTAFILGVAIVATLLPLVTDSIEVAQVCNMLFYAACLLVPYYLRPAWCGGCSAWCCRKWRMVPRRSACWPLICWPPAPMRSRRLRNRKRRTGRT